MQNIIQKHWKLIVALLIIVIIGILIYLLVPKPVKKYEKIFFYKIGDNYVLINKSNVNFYYQNKEIPPFGFAKIKKPEYYEELKELKINIPDKILAEDFKIVTNKECSLYIDGKFIKDFKNETTIYLRRGTHKILIICGKEGYYKEVDVNYPKLKMKVDYEKFVPFDKKVMIKVKTNKKSKCQIYVNGKLSDFEFVPNTIISNVMVVCKSHFDEDVKMFRIFHIDNPGILSCQRIEYSNKKIVKTEYDPNYSIIFDSEGNLYNFKYFTLDYNYIISPISNFFIGFDCIKLNYGKKLENNVKIELNNVIKTNDYYLVPDNNDGEITIKSDPGYLIIWADINTEECCDYVKIDKKYYGKISKVFLVKTNGEFKIKIHKDQSISNKYDIKINGIYLIPSDEILDLTPKIECKLLDDRNIICKTNAQKVFIDKIYDNEFKIRPKKTITKVQLIYFDEVVVKDIILPGDDFNILIPVEGPVCLKVKHKRAIGFTEDLKPIPVYYDGNLICTSRVGKIFIGVDGPISMKGDKKVDKIVEFDIPFEGYLANFNYVKSNCGLLPVDFNGYCIVKDKYGNRITKYVNINYHVKVENVRIIAPLFKDKYLKFEWDENYIVFDSYGNILPSKREGKYIIVPYEDEVYVGVPIGNYKLPKLDVNFSEVNGIVAFPIFKTEFKLNTTLFFEEDNISGSQYISGKKIGVLHPNSKQFYFIYNNPYKLVLICNGKYVPYKQFENYVVAESNCNEIEVYEVNYPVYVPYKNYDEPNFVNFERNYYYKNKNIDNFEEWEGKIIGNGLFIFRYYECHEKDDELTSNLNFVNDCSWHFRVYNLGEINIKYSKDCCGKKGVDGILINPQIYIEGNQVMLETTS